MDGGNGKGNNETVSIEICVNPDSVFSTACRNTAEITADILKRNGITTARGWVHQHNVWSGKNCPENIRKNGTWNDFLNQVQALLNGQTPSVQTPSTNTGDTVLYRVRKSWVESASQLGAFKDLNNAKDCVNKNPGYCVFDSEGNVVYPIAQGSTIPTEAKKYVNLHAVRESWAVYPLNVQPVKANAYGYLNPKQFGGLSYRVIKSLGGSVYVINTSSFGMVQIYCTGDNEGEVSSTPRYSKGNIDSDSIGSVNQTVSGADTEISRTEKSGTCYPNTTLNFRNAPSTEKGIVEGQYWDGEFVYYDLVVETTKYTWISWVGRTGTRRYMAVKDKTSGKTWAKY